MCPDGKLEVGGESSRCGTGGRCRSMSSVVTRKITAWPVTQIARITDSRQRWNTSRNTTTVTAVSPTIVGVSPNSVPKCVSVSPVGVRCFSSQRSSPASASANAVRLQHLRDQQPEQDHHHPDGEPPRQDRLRRGASSCHTSVRPPAS